MFNMDRKKNDREGRGRERWNPTRGEGTYEVEAQPAEFISFIVRH